MPGPILSLPMRERGAGLGWHGKLPAAGDFVHRNLSRALIDWWDDWLEPGLAALVAEQDEVLVQQAYAAAPIWNFALPAGLGTGLVQLGCVGASRDRVGRRYPLCLVAYLEADRYEARLLESASEFYLRLGRCLAGVLYRGYDVAQLEQVLAQTRPHQSDALPSAEQGDFTGRSNLRTSNVPFAERGSPTHQALALCFNPGSHTSYWWTQPVAGKMPRNCVHGGALTSSLFKRLFLASGVPSLS